MVNEKRQKQLARVQSKKALADLEATEGETMRGDAIAAKHHAETAIEKFQQTGDIDHLRNARDLLENNIAGTRGGGLHAETHFERAIEELESIPHFDEDDA